MTIGERLKEERERLGFAQPAFAGLAETTKKSQIDYEKNLTQPKAGYFAAIAKVGADVQYIVTGIRSAAALSEDEAELIALFRKAPLAVRASAMAGLSAGAKPQPKEKQQVFHGGVGQVSEGSITNESGVSFNFGVSKTKE